MTLAAYLEKHAITPASFAAQVGMPASTISRIINGQRQPRVDTVARIVEATSGAVTFSDFAPVPSVAAVSDSSNNTALAPLLDGSENADPAPRGHVNASEPALPAGPAR